jgi:hypothetical protein
MEGQLERRLNRLGEMIIRARVSMYPTDNRLELMGSILTLKLGER